MGENEFSQIRRDGAGGWADTTHTTADNQRNDGRTAGTGFGREKAQANLHQAQRAAASHPEADPAQDSEHLANKRHKRARHWPAPERERSRLKSGATTN